MKLNYIYKVKANVSIHANKRTTSVLDGTYRSVYKGKSMNFENLREYALGDDVQDVAWKPSARSGKLLVKQFVAEKKHNVLLAMDGGVKMTADSDRHENKKTIALFTAGTIGYVAINNNDRVGMVFATPQRIELRPFRYGVNNLEGNLAAYEAVGAGREVGTGKGSEAGRGANVGGTVGVDGAGREVSTSELLEYIYKYVPQRTIIFLITDIAGVMALNAGTLLKVLQRHDLLVVSINDNWMTGENVYDVASGEYVPEFLLEDGKLNEVERQLREEMLRENVRRFRRERVGFTTIGSAGQIIDKVVELLKEHKYAGIHRT